MAGDLTGQVRAHTYTRLWRVKIELEYLVLSICTGLTVLTVLLDSRFLIGQHLTASAPRNPSHLFKQLQGTARVSTPMDNRDETSDEHSAGAVPTHQSPDPDAALDPPSRRDDEGLSTSPPPVLLSVTAIVAAAEGLVRGGDTTPAADYFVPLPGGDDELEVAARCPPFKPFKPKKSDTRPPGHGILEEPATLGGGGGGSSSKWGVEELLGSKAGARNRKGFAASAKSTIVSGLGRLTAAAARSGAAGDDGMADEPCEYVAMSTPCESPVNTVRAGTMCGCVCVCGTGGHGISSEGGAWCVVQPWPCTPHAVKTSANT